jgi:hypothetical protein
MNVVNTDEFSFRTTISQRRANRKCRTGAGGFSFSQPASKSYVKNTMRLWLWLGFLNFLACVDIVNLTQVSRYFVVQSLPYLSTSCELRPIICKSCIIVFSIYFSDCACNDSSTTINTRSYGGKSPTLGCKTAKIRRRIRLRATADLCTFLLTTTAMRHLLRRGLSAYFSKTARLRAVLPSLYTNRKAL